LAPRERQQVLLDWNDTAQAIPTGYVQQWFESQAALAPLAMAVLGESGSLSYGELDAQANQLAHFLHTLGIGPDTLVGLCLHRCADLLVAMLGILKAGAAYLPLDPVYPRERLAYILEDSCAPVLLTQEALTQQLPSHRVHLLVLDTLQEQIRSCPRTPPVSTVRPEQLAYT